jgi:hypothetical protein
VVKGRPRTGFSGTIFLSASSSNAAEIDWSAVRAKMMTDETRADADRAKEAFQKRLSAATSVGQVAEVDWSYFKKGERKV